MSGAKKRLAEFKIDVPQNVFVKQAEDAPRRFSADLSYPLVIKGMGFAHKTESGAVALNIQNEVDLRDRLLAMNAPEGYLIEEMISQTVIELLIGIIHDPAHGAYLTIRKAVFTQNCCKIISQSVCQQEMRIFSH